MTKLNVIVDASCASHPHIRSGMVPRQGLINVSPRRLFSLGSMIFQDAVVGRKTYKQTKLLWETLHGQYNVYLDFGSREIITGARSEFLTKLSEIVGIGCGLAALASEFDVNINRFSRFLPSTNTRRVDFEFLKKRRRFFHETKGTTYNENVNSLKSDIILQKNDTGTYCNGPGNGPAMTASTGSITVYQHQDRSGHSSCVYLVDPPVAVGGYDQMQEPDELVRVLKYYYNYLKVTHFVPANRDLMGISKWLEILINMLERGKPLPKTPPKNMIARARVTELGSDGMSYGGSFIDARTSVASLRKFATFEEADANIVSPTSFVGVSQELVQLIIRCDWDGVLGFVDKGSYESMAADDFSLLNSGVMVKEIYLNGEELRESKNWFTREKRRISENKQ